MRFVEGPSHPCLLAVDSPLKGCRISGKVSLSLSGCLEDLASPRASATPLRGSNHGTGSQKKLPLQHVHNLLLSYAGPCSQQAHLHSTILEIEEKRSKREREGNRKTAGFRTAFITHSEFQSGFDYCTHIPSGRLDSFSHLAIGPRLEQHPLFLGFLASAHSLHRHVRLREGRCRNLSGMRASRRRQEQ